MILGIVSGQLANVDQYWESVHSLAHFDNGFSDAVGGTWTPTAGVNIQADSDAFGGFGAFSGGNNEWVNRTIPALGTQDFTLEFRVKLTVLSQATKRLIDNRSAGITANGFTLALQSPGSITLTIGGVTTTSAAVGGLNTISSLCVQRSGNNFTVYLNGSPVIITSSSASLPYTTLRMMNSIVNSAQWTTQGAQGLLDEARLTIGVARYGASYVPATSAFPEG